MALFFISFFAGVLTVISPCVLPLLPVIVGGSLAGGTSARRAATVTLSLGVSVFLFTFILKVSTIFISIPPEAWQWLSGGILFAIGVFFLIPHLWDLIPGAATANRSSTALMSQGFMKETFWGDVVVGAALGPVFSTCSPTYFVVLASVLPVSLAAGTLDIIAYVVGMCAFLLIITLAGQKLADRLGFAADPNGWFRRTVGILFVIIGIVIVTGTAAAIEAPLYSVFDETKIEQKLLEKGMHDAMPASAATTTDAMASSSAAAPMPGAAALAMKQAKYHLAPELVLPDGYLNTDGAPINLAQYRGKDVVLLDFWDYSCINCERTLPYLTSWYAKYKDKGLVVIGVHTPEFSFEHDPANVAAAMKRFGIDYPVVLDNEYKTWNAYQNQYWPHEYVIDIDGFITHDHAGEGEYDETEKAIQAALAERAARLGMAPSSVPAALTPAIAASNAGPVASPETYFGSSRNEYLGNGTPGISGEQTFTLPDAPPPINTFYLGGTWNLGLEFAESEGDTVISYRYASSDVYFVAATDGTPVTVDVYRDGKPVGQFAGSDVNPATSSATITEDRLYRLVHDPSPGEHTLELRIHGAGLRAYTFTFG